MKVHCKSPPPPVESGSSASDAEDNTVTSPARTSSSSENVPQTSTAPVSATSPASTTSSTSIVSGHTHSTPSLQLTSNMSSNSVHSNSIHNSLAMSHHHSHPPNLSEWYVCQSAAGMPTPPSNEHSPIGLSHLSSLHHHAVAQY